MIQKTIKAALAIKQNDKPASNLSEVKAKVDSSVELSDETKAAIVKKALDNALKQDQEEKNKAQKPAAKAAVKPAAPAVANKQKKVMKLNKVKPVLVKEKLYTNDEIMHEAAKKVANEEIQSKKVMSED